MITTINMTDDQITAIVIQDLKQSYMICNNYVGQDEEARADIAALKRVLEYYMIPSEAKEFFSELDKHSKHYFDVLRNK
jgi:hypothetical protein